MMCPNSKSKFKLHTTFGIPYLNLCSNYHFKLKKNSLMIEDQCVKYRGSIVFIINDQTFYTFRCADTERCSRRIYYLEMCGLFIDVQELLRAQPLYYLCYFNCVCLCLSSSINSLFLGLFSMHFHFEQHFVLTDIHNKYTRTFIDSCLFCLIDS